MKDNNPVSSLLLFLLAATGHQQALQKPGGLNTKHANILENDHPN